MSHKIKCFEYPSCQFIETIGVYLDKPSKRRRKGEKKKHRKEKEKKRKEKEGGGYDQRKVEPLPVATVSQS